MKKTLLVLIFVFSFFHTAFAVTTACNGSQGDCQAKVTAATAGDTITIPSGTWDWSSGVTIAKGITVQGAGTSTVIHIIGSNAFTINGNGSGNYRVTNMKFTGASTSGRDVSINGVWDSMRIDNIAWQTTTSICVMVGYGHAWDILFSGTSIPHQKILIDNINYNSSSGGTPFCLIYGRNHLAWQEVDGFGTDNFVYIESSTFNWPSSLGYVTDTEFAGRFVFRHNTVYNGGAFMHDLGSTPRSRGNRAVEMYENNFVCNIAACSGTSVAMNNTRGGGGIYFNNTVTGYSLPTWNMIYRVAYNNSFIGGGYCSETGSRKVCQSMAKRCVGGTNSKKPCYVDGDCPGSTCGDYTCSSNADCLDFYGAPSLCMQLDGSVGAGYPCRDQIGRGQDDPTTGVQAASPVYWYNNTVSGVSNAPFVVGSASAYTVENRDYCNHSPATTCGLKAGWAYTAYTYPHPWRSGEVADTTPPVISSPLPTGTVTCTTNPVDVTRQVTTNEAANCRLSLTDVAYESMADNFDVTGGTTHTELDEFACGATYTYYVRCVDLASNASTSSTVLSFTIASWISTTVTPTITTPTSGTTYATSSSNLSISGTTQGDAVMVTWSNNRGGSGACSGAMFWSASDIQLYSGDNLITITATDTYGATGVDTLMVTYTPPASPITKGTQSQGIRTSGGIRILN